MTKTKIKEKDMRKFYKFLDHKKETEIRVIDPNRGDFCKSHFVNNIEEFIKVCKNYNGKYNIYAGINERKEGGTKKEDVKNVKIIPLDIDAPHPKGEAAKEEELQKAKDVMGEIYNDFTREGFKKPMIEMTGNGYQILWKIPKIKITDENREKVEKKIHNFIKEVKEKYEKNGVEIDQISDLPRILKIPGTKSVKGEDTEKRPHRVAKIVENPEPESCPKMRDKILMTEIVDKKEVSRGNKGVDTKKLKFFFKLDEKLKKLYKDKITEDYKSRSEAEQALVNKLVFYGFNEEQIDELMKECEIGKWQEKGDSYRDLTIKKAFECVDERFEMENDLYFIDENDKPIPLNIAKDILDQYNIITLRDNEQMFFYNDGIYHRNSEAKIKEEAQKRVNDISRNHKKEVIELIKGLTYIDRDEVAKNKHLLHLKNGIYNLESNKLEDFSPKKISLTQLPIKYDPNADCPKIKKFISEIVNKDDVKLIQEMFGYCLLKDYPFSRAFMLLGSGSNGKSTLLDLLSEFLGEENIAPPSLQDLLKDRFAKIELYGKLANIHGDLSSEKLENTGAFKMLTGGDIIYGQKKFQDPIKFRNHAKLIYSANELPRTTDRTDAFFRRWIVIDFPYQFKEGDEETDANLPYSIITEEEMSGLFNWALKGLKRILKNQGFSHTSSRDEIKQKWIMKTDSLRAFLKVACECEDGEFVGKEDFYKIYKLFCDENNVYCVSKSQVTKRLPTIKPRVSLFRPLVGDEQIRSWKNLKIKEKFLKNAEYIQDIQLTATIPNIWENNNNNYIKNTPKSLDMLDMKKYQKKPKNKEKVSQMIGDKKMSYFELEQKAKEELDIDENRFQKIIDNLKENKEIFEPNPGFLKRL